MYKLASSLASKVGLAKNSVRPVAFRLSSSVTAAETNGHRLIKRSPFNDLEYHRLPLFGMYNPACDVRDYFEWWSSSVPSPVYKYATAMSQAMYGEKPKALVAGAKDEDLLHGIKIAYSVVREHLERCGSLVSSYEELIQVGTVAASGDRRIGELVAKAIEEVGPEGAFIISDKVKSNNELVFDKGMSLAWGLVSPFFCTSKEEETCVLQNPYVLITNKISSIQIFDVALSLSLNINNRPLLVITYDIEMEEVAVLMQDWAYFKVKVYVAKPLEYKGYTKEDAKAIMKDLAILTGGQVERQQIVGSCKEVRATRNSVVILGGSGSQLDIKERCEQLRSAIELSTSDDGQLLKERLKKLSHGAAVFKVCGDSKAEVRKKIKTFRNAVEAAKAAMNVGILPGGGVALLHASTELDKLQLPHKDVKLGVQLFQHALKMPVYSIASSAGFDGLAIVNKLLEQENANLGYDPIKGEYVDMIKAGNIDPLRFIIEAMDAFVTAFKLELFRTRATSQ